MTESSNALLEQLAVLIPLSAPEGSWEFGLAEVVSAAWSKDLPEVQVIWGYDGGDGSGPFHYSRAMNLARSMTSRTLIMNSEGTHLPPDRWGIINAIRTLLRQDLPWVRPFRNRRMLDEATTRNYLQDPTTQLASSVHVGGMSISLVRAQVWDDIEYDERLLGAGFENGVFRRALKALYPGGRRLGQDGPFVLWRPEANVEPNLELHEKDNELFQQYIAATGARPGSKQTRRMRELVEAAKANRSVGFVRLSVREPVATTTQGDVEIALGGPNPDPASGELADQMSLGTLVETDDEFDATGTMVTATKTPVAVEGYRWPADAPEGDLELETESGDTHDAAS